MKEQRYTILTIIWVGLALLLAGCNKQAAANNANTPINGGGPPLSMQLALGTLKLEGTDEAVTPEQAAELLPLWKAARSLSDSDTVTVEETDAVFRQIQAAMTPGQMEAIQSMDLSGQNMAEIAQELGIELPSGGPGNLSEEQRATLEAGRESLQGSGGFAGGGGPGGGPGGFPGMEGPPLGAGLQGSSSNSEQTARQPRQGGGFGTLFYQAVIDLLEKKTR